MAIRFSRISAFRLDGVFIHAVASPWFRVGGQAPVLPRPRMAFLSSVRCYRVERLLPLTPGALSPNIRLR